MRKRGANHSPGTGVCAVLSVVMCLAVVRTSTAQNRVIGYYPSWERGNLPASSMMFQHLTHVNQAFAWPLADGTISGYSDLIYPALVTAAHQAGRKVMVSLGGWGQSDGFAPMTADSVIRARFVDNLVAYLQTHGFDGADLDWETPKNSIERGNLVKLVREIREAFLVQNPDWLLTMAIPAGSWGGANFDYAAMTPSLDWYNVMNYDTHGSWTAHAGHNCPLYAPAFEADGSTDQSVRYLNGTRGIPKSKLVIGIPFYGKEFTADSLYRPSTGCTDLAYRVIPARISAGWRRYWDPTSHVPYLVMPEVHRTVCYDDSLSVSDKTTYAVAGGLGGVMIWALGQDVIGGKQPLLDAIGIAMAGATGVAERIDDTVPGELRLEQNYPNPFNPKTAVRFQLPAAGNVTLVMYDALGREVSVLVEGHREAGTYQVTWDARGMPSGVYFCRLASGGVVQTRRMVLAK